MSLELEIAAYAVPTILTWRHLVREWLGTTAEELEDWQDKDYDNPPAGIAAIGILFLSVLWPIVLFISTACNPKALHAATKPMQLPRRAGSKAKLQERIKELEQANGMLDRG